MFDPHLMIPLTDVENDRYFSKIDLSKGYWQILVRQEEIPKMAFVTIINRHNEFLRIPIWMMSSGAILTHAVKKLERGVNHVDDYVDDILVHTPTWEKDMRTLLKRLQQANFKLRPTKCVLGVQR
ncbi:Zinc finger protein [Plakobranchus ocellatus]|uniref:Zinc finger protein n=1 Tax=Plakobranchus ocellatus TaxID=259542 RepID=A0AAV3YM65_9GAST|nr:Zinc finger protein [Plakobranchus ocellatus]